jgi:alpha/beta superfamily hydrolase
MTLEPLYFKSGDQSLFGIFEPAADSCKCVAVICNAFEPEHVGCHRALKKLGKRLGRTGIDVFRFDFAGMGDSSGDFGDMGFEQWRADLNAAIDLARCRFRCKEVVLIGVRMSATLAALACAERGDIHAAVLWEPPMDGNQFIDDLRHHHNTPTPDGVLLPSIHTTADGVTEIVGLQFTERLSKEFEKTSLHDLQWPTATPVQVVTNVNDGSAAKVAALLASQTADIEHTHINARLVWIDQEQGLVPAPVIQAIAQWIQQQL